MNLVGQARAARVITVGDFSGMGIDLPQQHSDLGRYDIGL